MEKIRRNCYLLSNRGDEWAGTFYHYGENLLATFPRKKIVSLNVSGVTVSLSRDDAKGILAAWRKKAKA